MSLRERLSEYIRDCFTGLWIEDFSRDGHRVIGYCVFPWGPHRVARNKSDFLLGAISQWRKLPAFSRWFQLRAAISRDLLARRRRSCEFNRGTLVFSSFPATANSRDVGL